mmetsp:Transcript_63064/g.133124  ORF Transcript_63064/g.133124 Transcript_63064/m.133124 type:complete len:130 (+) Transcript_63064:476-865(+)
MALTGAVQVALPPNPGSQQRGQSSSTTLLPHWPDQHCALRNAENKRNREASQWTADTDEGGQPHRCSHAFISLGKVAPWVQGSTSGRHSTQQESEHRARFCLRQDLARSAAQSVHFHIPMARHKCTTKT